MKVLKIAWLVPLLLLLSGCQGRYWSQAELDLIARLNAQVAVTNAQAKLDFDPETETIIAENASHLVKQYQLNVAHQFDKFAHGPKQLITHRMVRYPGCNRAKAKTDQSFFLSGDRATGICSLKLYGETPPANALTTRTIRRIFDIDDFKVVRRQIIIRRPDGRQVSLLYFPGQADVNRETGVLFASALNLKPRRSVYSSLPGPADVERLIAASKSRVDASKNALLDQLAETGKLPPQISFSARHFEPDVIATRTEQLVTQFERAARGEDTANSWRILGDLLARLPQENWLRYRQRIFAALMVGPKKEYDVQQRLVLRLVDMGADAGPLLMRLSGDTHISREIKLAACRIGAPVGQQLRERFLANWKQENAPQMTDVYRPPRGENRVAAMGGEIGVRRWKSCVEDGRKSGPPDTLFLSACWYHPLVEPREEMMYLALKRMGYGAEADDIAHYRRRDLGAHANEKVGPNSPAKVCGQDELM